METPRIESIPPLRVVSRRYAGPRPPAQEFFAHWRSLRAWAREHGVTRSVPEIVMLGYEPPGRPGARRFEYDACIPTEDEVPEGDDTVDVWQFPGGHFILVRGELTELPLLYREARIHAGHRGIAYERGGLEIYRPHPDNPKSYLMDAGVGIHELPS